MTGAAHQSSAEGRIRERLRRDGRLTFAAVMAEALYGPDGYYTTRTRLGGRGADFFTSPELHPAFGALLGRCAATVWAALGRPGRFDLVEHGPGSGALCRDLLGWAAHEHPAFADAIHYQLVETSPALRATQRMTLHAAGLLDPAEAIAVSDPLDAAGLRNAAGPLDGRVQWTTKPVDERSVDGLVLANELVDAFPVHLVAVRQGRLVERYVALDREHLTWVEDEPSTPELAAYFERLGLRPGEGCVAEVNLAGVTWLERAAQTLRRGALLLLDYGYPAAELYAPRRRHGTLLTYRSHALGSDPLVRLGSQDITTHVDFTSLALAGERGGLDTVGLIDQADLLARLGLPTYLGLLDGSSVSATEHEQNRRALLALVDPNGLGRVRALLQTRGLDAFAPLDLTGVPPISWLSLLHAGQMRLPGPLDAEGFVDVDAQWRDLFGEHADADDDDADANDAEQQRPQ